MKDQKDKVTFPCDTCEHVSKSKASMKKHSISHSVDLQTCDECDQLFATSKGLVLHKARLHKATSVTEALVKVSSVNPDKRDADFASVDEVEGTNKQENGGLKDDVKTVKDKKVRKKSSKGKSKKLKQQKEQQHVENSVLTEALSVFDTIEPVHQVAKASLFDFWSDGEDDFKLLWLEEMSSSSCSPGCHCRACQPCTKPCCENSAVRTGRCCDPSTLGSCLQPYQAQCFAPCCHHSVELRDNFRWVGGTLVEVVGKVDLVNPLGEEGDIIGDVLEDERLLQEELGNCSEDDLVQERDVDISNKSSDYVPQAFINNSITEYLDSKLGKAIPKSNYRKEFYKFYKDSSLPGGCRIVHKKLDQYARVEVYFRSRCGRHFNTRSELRSFVKTCEEAVKKDNAKVVFKKASLVKTLQKTTKEFVENLYKNTVEVDFGLKRCKTIPLVPIKRDISKTEKSTENSLRVNNVEAKYDKVFDKSNVKMLKKKKDEDFEQDDTIPTMNGPSSQIIKEKKQVSDNKSESKKLECSIQKQNLGKNSRPQDQSIPNKLPIRPGVKTCHCEECGITLSLSEITKHLVTIHPGVKMNRCMICKSGFMNIHSFKQHKNKFHAEEVTPVKVETGNENGQVNTSTSDLNDSVETLDKIEHFLKTSITTTQKANSNNITSARQIVPIKTNGPQSRSTLSSNKVNNSRMKKLGGGDTQKAKRNRSTANSVLDIPSTRKRLRTSYSEDFSEIPVRDTDPQHPTSSINLRLKGRNYKGTKKLSPMGLLTIYNKYQLDPSTTINDCVDGEVLVFKPVRPEFYYCISAEEPANEVDEHDDMKDNNDRQTNSNILRRKGREHKGRKELKPFPPLLDYTEDIVSEYMIDKEGPGVADIERFFKISS